MPSSWRSVFSCSLLTMPYTSFRFAASGVTRHVSQMELPWRMAAGYTRVLTPGAPAASRSRERIIILMAAPCIALGRSGCEFFKQLVYGIQLCTQRTKDVEPLTDTQHRDAVRQRNPQFDRLAFRLLEVQDDE